jgi:hypothetical protein
MPKQIPLQFFDQIVAAIARYPGGIGMEGLLQELGEGVARRTLQRRLETLLQQRRIASEGSGRGVRYRLAGQHPYQHFFDRVSEPEDVGNYTLSIPLSEEGKVIQTYVRQPRALRKPVGYQYTLLENYHPNYTAYLPERLRTQLHGMGGPRIGETPAGTFARDILNRLLIDLSWASSRLEGNTYSRLDTERLIDFGQVAEGKDLLEAQMILNHKAAIEYLVHDPDKANLSVETVLALHAFLSDGLLPDPMACGRIRHCQVEIGGSVYLPLVLPQRLEEMLGIIIGTAAEIHDPFEQAFFLMVHLPYLQPFEDVNKRVSRLAANIPFIRHNLSPLSFIDVPQRLYVDAVLGVYELNRIELLRDVFVWAYARSCQQYVAVKQQLVPPDIFRLRHRVLLAEVVAGMVRNGEAVTEANIRARIPMSLPSADHAQFVALVMTEFKTLHAGNAVRFGLRPLEFEAWQAGSNNPL